MEGDTVALTNLAIRKLKPPATGRFERYDRLIPGFGVRITDKGTKSYIFVYPHGGRRHRYTIGRVGEISLEDARDKARELRSLIRQGRHPVAERKAQWTPKAAPVLFGDVVELFDRRFLSKKRSGHETRRIIDRELLPHWKDRPLTSITSDDVHDRIDALLDVGKREAARRLFEITRRLFNWVRSQRDGCRIERSPCADLSPKELFDEKPIRKRTLNDAELRAMWHASECMGYPFGPMLRLLALTGLRRNEVAHARWTEFDFNKSLWTIPPHRMKSGAGHVVPLTSEMLTILNALPHHGEFLFTSKRRNDRPISGFTAMKARLDALMDKEIKVADWTIHDIRRTMRTQLSSLPIPGGDLVRELVIAHAKPGLHRIYDQHAYLDERRSALELWAARLRGIIEQPAAKVVALRAS
jgi:integrase